MHKQGHVLIQNTCFHMSQFCGVKAYEIQKIPKANVILRLLSGTCGSTEACYV